MKKNIPSRVLLSLLLVSAGARAQECAAPRGIRTLAGPQPLVSTLRAEIARQDADMLFKDGQFEEERFSYIGEVVVTRGAKWHVALIRTIWPTGGCARRATKRLLVFSETGSYIGQYSHFMPQEIRISGDTVFFDDVAPGAGNEVRFSNEGPPRHAWLDGEVLDFYR